MGKILGQQSPRAVVRLGGRPADAAAPVPAAMEREPPPPPPAPKPLCASKEAAKAHGAAFWQNYQDTMQPHDAAIYFDPERLYALLAEGPDGRLAPVRLLKGSRLLMRARRLEKCTTEEERQRWRLPRRQELVEADFLTEKQVRALPRGHVGKVSENCICCWGVCEPLCCGDCNDLEQTRKDKPLRLISISHGWLTPDHPDPSGQQLEKFAEMVRRERQCCPGDGDDVCCRACICALTLGGTQGYCCCILPCFGQRCGELADQFPAGEFAVFYDYGSLHQKDAAGQRSEAEVDAFKTALDTMGMWYAHRLTTTYIMSELPAGWPRTPEAAPFFPEGWLKGKGWPSFERAVSGMIKRGADTSWRRIVDPAVPRGISNGYRAPPMHPREFASELALKVFSNGADCDVVARLYADSFMGALGEATDLEFSALQWGDADAEAFAEVLPLLRRVETLDLFANKIGSRGLAALAAAIRVGAAPKLKQFQFGGNDGDSAPLREACEARGIAM